MDSFGDSCQCYYLHVFTYNISPDELQLDYSPKDPRERSGLNCLPE